MKKLFVSLFVFVAIVTNSFAQTVIVERPGILTDLSNALITVPCAAATGVVQGIVEAGRSLICGSTTVVRQNPQTVVIPHTPVSVGLPQHVVTTSPLVVGVPTTTVVTTTPPAVVVSPTVVVQPAATTTIVRQYGCGVTTTVTRPASAYEIGTTVVAPVAPGCGVGPSPFVNPYVHRPHGF